MSNVSVDTIYYDLGIDLSEQLISLDSILKVAEENSPTLMFEEASIERSVQNLKSQRFIFLNGISGFYNYTAGDQVNVVQNANANPVLSNNFGIGTRYGFNLVMPVSEFLTRPNRNKMLKAEINMAKHKKNDVVIALKRQIIADYFNLIAAQKVFNIRIQDFEGARLTTEIANVEMKRGKITPQELGRIKNQQAIIESNLEMSKKDFMTYYYQLETLVGVKLNSLKRVK